MEVVVTYMAQERQRVTFVCFWEESLMQSVGKGWSDGGPVCHRTASQDLMLLSGFSNSEEKSNGCQSRWGRGGDEKS